MKQLIGFLMIIIGIILGLYVGVWLMFIGGILQIITEISQLGTPLFELINIGFGILRIMLATITGTISSFLLIIPGMKMFLDL